MPYPLLAEVFAYFCEVRVAMPRRAPPRSWSWSLVFGAPPPYVRSFDCRGVKKYHVRPYHRPDVRLQRPTGLVCFALMFALRDLEVEAAQQRARIVPGLRKKDRPHSILPSTPEPIVFARPQSRKDPGQRRRSWPGRPSTAQTRSRQGLRRFPSVSGFLRY